MLGWGPQTPAWQATVHEQSTSERCVNGSVAAGVLTTGPGSPELPQSPSPGKVSHWSVQAPRWPTPRAPHVHILLVALSTWRGGPCVSLRGSGADSPRVSGPRTLPWSPARGFELHAAGCEHDHHT